MTMHSENNVDYQTMLQYIMPTAATAPACLMMLLAKLAQNSQCIVLNIK